MLINSGLITRLKKHFKTSYIAVLIKKALHLSVNVFSTKVLIEDTIFTSPTGTGPPFYVVIQATQRFSIIFKTLSVGPVPGIEPLTSRSAVRCSSD